MYHNKTILNATLLTNRPKTALDKAKRENQAQYDEPDLNKSQKTRPMTPTASKVIPLGTIITIV